MRESLRERVAGHGFGIVVVRNSGNFRANRLKLNRFFFPPQEGSFFSGHIDHHFRAEWTNRSLSRITVCVCVCVFYLLMVDEAERRLLGSLSDLGIFHGPGDTVAFLLAMLPVFLDIFLSPASLSGSRGWPLTCCMIPTPPTQPALTSPLPRGGLGRSRFLSLDRLLLDSAFASSERFWCPLLPPELRRLALLPSRCRFCPLLDPAPAFSTTLGPWWQLSRASVLISEAWHGSVHGFTWDDGNGSVKLSRGGATSDTLEEDVGLEPPGAELSAGWNKNS